MSIRQADRIVHKAAWLYYTHGLRQDEVAKRLDISRASVATYLRRARETGIVTIAASTELFADDVLARHIEDRYRLESVWISQDLEPVGTAQAVEGASVPALGASVFLSLAQSGQQIGVAWGRTVYEVADVMAFADLRDVTVMELCGNLGAPYSYLPDQCTVEIARRLNARGLNIFAPLILSSAALAEALRAEPVIAEQLDRVGGCDLALFSAGLADHDAHIVKCGALTPHELDRLIGEGAAGVIAGQLIDASGEALDCDYNRRAVSADLGTIRRIPTRLMVVQELAKLGALRAALAGGFATHLVLSRALAAALIDDADSSPR